MSLELRRRVKDLEHDAVALCARVDLLESLAARVQALENRQNTALSMNVQIPGVMRGRRKTAHDPI